MKLGPYKITVEKVLYLGIFLFPIFPFFSSLAMIIYGLFGLMHFQREKVNYRRAMLYAAISAPFIINLISALYSPNTDR